MRSPLAVFVLSSVLGAGLAASARAEDAAPLTLVAAQAEARAHGPDVAVLDADVAGADRLTRARDHRFGSNPELSASYAAGAAGGDGSDQAARIGLEWTVDLSGAWRDSLGAAEAERDRAGASRRSGLAVLDESVAVAFADLAFAQRQLARAEKIESLQQISRDAARRQLDTAHGTQLDVDAAELDLAAASAALAWARDDLEVAQIALARTLGRADHDRLVVVDAAEEIVVPSEADLDTLVDRDPRVQAAAATVRAAGLERRAAGRSSWAAPTVGLDLDYATHDLPTGSFAGAPALSASWHDWELGVHVGLPLALVDRHREQRARTSSVEQTAAAQLGVVRAEVRAEIERDESHLQGAVAAWSKLAPTAVTIDREYELLDKAFRAGALDVGARAQAARRLVEAGARLDGALRDLRVAWARFLRERLAAPDHRAQAR